MSNYDVHYINILWMFKSKLQIKDKNLLFDEKLLQTPIPGFRK